MTDNTTNAPPAPTPTYQNGQVIGGPAPWTPAAAEAATAALAEMKRAYDARNNLPADPAKRDAILTGRSPAPEPGDPPPAIFTMTQGSEITPAEREVAIDGLRTGGDLPAGSEAYIRGVEAGTETFRPSEGDALLAREARERYFGNAENRTKYLNGDPTAKRIMSGLNRVISYSQPDGRPASTEMHQLLVRDGLR